jgi:predicted metal-dependent hydrolase
MLLPWWEGNSWYVVPANTPQSRARIVAMMWSTVVKYTHKRRGGGTE